MPTLALPVVEIKIGTGSDREAHFLAIRLERQPTLEEIKEICAIMHTHFRENDGPFMNREFVKNEIHLWPTGKSREHFKTAKSAYEEYAEILKILGLARWINDLPLDGNLCLDDERSSASPDVSAAQLQELAQANMVCVLP